MREDNGIMEKRETNVLQSCMGHKIQGVYFLGLLRCGEVDSKRYHR